MGRPILVVLALLALPATAQAAAARLYVDPGEGRTPASSILVYKAAAGEANRLTVTLDDGTFNLDDAVPITPGAHCSRPVAADPTRVRCTGAEDGDAEIALGDGDDQARVPSGEIFATIDAGPGDDRVHGQSVSGGAGEDRIYGFGLDGGPGNDIEVADDAPGHGATFDEGAAADGADLLVGSAGQDQISFAGRSTPVRV